MTIHQEDIVRSIEALSIDQLDQLVEGFTQRLGLPRPQGVQAALVDGALPPAPPVADSFAVVIVEIPYKIMVIKALRELSSLGLKEAKDLADSPLPITFREELSQDEARAVAAKLTEAGARVEVRA